MPKGISNAKVVSTFIGREDHGIPTYIIQLKDASGTQGFGMRANAHSHIQMILDVLGVKSWEKLPGIVCRIDRKDGDMISRIGHVIEDSWFDPEALEENR